MKQEQKFVKANGEGKELGITCEVTVKQKALNINFRKTNLSLKQMHVFDDNQKIRRGSLFGQHFLTQVN